MAKAPPYDDVGFLVSRRFPGRWPSDATRPFFLHDGSPEAIAFELELRRKSPDEIRELVRAEERRVHLELAVRKASEDDKRFFNQVTAEANFDHWGRLAYWTLDEAVALSFGKEPEVVYWESLKPLIQISPFVQGYKRRLDIALRANESHQLDHRTAPADFLDWAERMEIPFPKELRTAVDTYTVAREPWRDRYLAATSALEETKRQLQRLSREAKSSRADAAATDEGHPRPRELESLLKLVLGMAVRGYKYDTRARKNSAIKDIADDLRFVGLGLDEDTVRKYLQRAKAEFPDLKTEDDNE